MFNRILKGLLLLPCYAAYYLGCGFYAILKVELTKNEKFQDLVFTCYSKCMFFSSDIDEYLESKGLAGWLWKPVPIKEQTEKHDE